MTLATFDVQGIVPRSIDLAPTSGRIRFFVPGVAVPWARAGRHGGVSYTPAKQKAFGTIVRDLGYEAMAGAPLLECAVRLQVIATYPWPRIFRKGRREAIDGAWKATRPDIDNIAKLISDNLNLIVWRDDAQVAAVIAYKLHGDTPGVDVTIAPLVGISPSEVGA